MRSILALFSRPRRLAVLLVGLAMPLPSAAQRLSVVGGAGGVAENATFRLTSTVGEPGVGSVLSPAFHHHAGFLGGFARALVATADEEDPASPTVLVLHPPAPNPSRGAARVQVDLPSPARVRLVVYDALGREVAVALDEERPAGRHTVALATDVLATGVYVVRLVAGHELATQQLTVVR